ncbi:hypothetical protein CsSME_00039590 [Camellia sinensis var. sinensis]
MALEWQSELVKHFNHLHLHPLALSDEKTVVKDAIGVDYPYQAQVMDANQQTVNFFLTSRVWICLTELCFHSTVNTHPLSLSKDPLLSFMYKEYLLLCYLCHTW